MVKKKPVNLTRQTIYIFIPGLSLLALYRIEKLRWGLVIGLSFTLVYWALDDSFGADYETFSDFVFEGGNLLYGILYLAILAINIVVIVYFIRKWSREWNSKEDVKAWKEDLD